ncbi:MAG: hypothetical protein QME63_01760 [Actinomycetota bacterium]|nr:hypothetical protein [Actinomycetota bacterium]
MQKINFKRAGVGAFVTLMVVCLVYVAAAVLEKDDCDKLIEAGSKSKEIPLKQQLSTGKNEGVPQGIIEDVDSMVDKYDPNISSTYKKPYAKLKNELLYARLFLYEKGHARHYVKTIRNKDRLVKIVREFDKLRSSVPREYNFSRGKSYVLVIWREGRSVSFVFWQNNSNFYEGSSALRTKKGNMVLRKMPEKLIRLIME